MNKYTRRQINQNALLHDKEFVTVDDAMKLVTDVAAKAVEIGADEVKMVEFFEGDGDE